MTPIITDCIPKQFTFEQEKLPPVVVNFQGGLVTSDAGLSLIADIDRKRQITSRLAQCFQDYREQNRSLRHDPMFALALKKRIGQKKSTRYIGR
ncbi:transposase [Nodularia chucula]|uniref:transposase n=1 Tax=Nodularia chucula TaxID=3093667 RepID=UPI0039C5D160